MKAYNLYYNQKVTLIPAESFFAVYWSQKSWYTKGTVLFIEDVETGDLRKFVVEFETELWKSKVDELRKSMPPEEIKEIIHDWWQDYEIADGTEDNLLAYV